MLEPDLVLQFVRPIERLGLPYMITGSVAGIFYGEPRLTHDVDIVLELPRHRANEICKAFPIGEFYCPPEEVLVIEAQRQRRGHFNLIHHASGFKADVYLVGDDALHFWALQRIHRIALGGTDVAIAPPEYVILRKLEFFREGGSEKHLRDITNILNMQAASVDRAAISSWADKLGIAEIWLKIEGME